MRMSEVGDFFKNEEENAPILQPYDTWRLLFQHFNSMSALPQYS